MTIHPIWIKGNHHIRPDPAKMVNNLREDGLWFDFVDITVDKIQQD
jgi:hypothetical protein